MKRITKQAWSRVHEKALEIANAAMRDDFVMAEVYTQHLLELLTELDEAFGPQAVLLATRADFLKVPAERLKLYEAALALAREQGDREEEVEILDSLRVMSEEQASESQDE